MIRTQSILPETETYAVYGRLQYIHSAFGVTHTALASFPGSSGGESRAWYPLFAHAREFTEQGQ